MRRSASAVVLTLALALSMGGTVARAAPPACMAWNTTSGATPTDLAAAIAAASAGDTISIAGVCYGSFTISSDLTLNRRGSHSVAILDGEGLGTVLTVGVGATVRIGQITITHAGGSGSGLVVFGGGADVTLDGTLVTKNTNDSGAAGVFNDSGTVHVKGSSRITKNQSTSTEGGGGGLANVFGTVTISGSAQITDNDGGPGCGGGILNLGQMTIAGSGQVNGNTSASGGGICNLNGGNLRVRGSAQVNGNTSTDQAGVGGGGILNRSATLRLEDFSQVNGNLSASVGGGVYSRDGSQTRLAGLAQITANTAATSAGGLGHDSVADTLAACRTWLGVISPNTPDDPPTLKLTRCGS